MEPNSPRYYQRPPDYPSTGVKKSQVATAQWLNEGQNPPPSDEIGIIVDTTEPNLKRTRLEKGPNDPIWKTPSDSMVTEDGVNNLTRLLREGHVFQELAIGDVATVTPLFNALKTCESHIGDLDLSCLTVFKQVGKKWQAVGLGATHVEGIAEIIANERIDRVYLEAALIGPTGLPTLATVMENHPNAAKISVVDSGSGIELAWDRASMLGDKKAIEDSPDGQVCWHLNDGNAERAMEVLTTTGRQTLDLSSGFLSLSAKGVDTLLEVLLSRTTKLDIVKLGAVSDFEPILRALPKLSLSTLDLGKAVVHYKNIPCTFRPEDVDTLTDVLANNPQCKTSLVIDSRRLPLEKAAELCELLQKTGTQIHDNYTPFIRYSPL